MVDVFHPAELSKMFAFTLAEVLITLGIIGIVAALTMPALIQNHRKQIVETSLKKFYSVVNQAVQMSELENGSSQNWERCIGRADYMSCAEWYNKYLKKYLKTVKEEVVTIKNLSSNSKTYTVYFTDGSMMLLLPSSYPEVYFFPQAKDFNKDTFLKNENDRTSLPDIGTKAFIFEFNKNINSNNKQLRLMGLLFCRPAFDEVTQQRYAICPSTSDEFLNDSSFGCNTSSNNKAYCTNLIQLNGWKIPKNYPFKL